MCVRATRTKSLFTHNHTMVAGGRLTAPLSDALTLALHTHTAHARDAGRDGTTEGAAGDGLYYIFGSQFKRNLPCRMCGFTPPAGA